MSNKMIYNQDARQKLFEGVRQIADAVKVTLGPCGRLVMFDNNGVPTVTKDGVTVAKKVDLKDPEENMGAQLVREVASKTNDVAGDNTTTATVLAYAIVKEGMKAVSSGVKPIELRRGIERAALDVSSYLLEKAKKVSTTKEITDVATISANNDPSVGTLLAEAIEKVGKDGVVITEESQNASSSVKFVDGYEVKKGYANPNFAYGADRGIISYEKAKILITDKKISAFNEILPVIEEAAKASLPIVFVCGGMEGEALGTLIMNVVRGTLKACVIEAPHFGEQKRAVLEDLAIYTGGTFFEETVNQSLVDVNLSMLGTAKVKITKENTTFTNGEGTADDIDRRKTYYQALANEATDQHEKEKYLSRLAKLAGGVAVISVGAVTKTELNEKKYRIEDTIAATRAALEEGIIPGGGVALLNASQYIDKEITDDATWTTDAARGYKILEDALKEPMKQIAENAGVNGDVVIENVLRENKYGYGYNAKTGNYVDMMEDGVIDTCKAMRNALLNAASIAGMILTTECVITKIPEEHKDPVMMATPMGAMPM